MTNTKHVIDFDGKDQVDIDLKDIMQEVTNYDLKAPGSFIKRITGVDFSLQYESTFIGDYVTRIQTITKTPALYLVRSNYMNRSRYGLVSFKNSIFKLEKGLGFFESDGIMWVNELKKLAADILSEFEPQDDVKQDDAKAALIKKLDKLAEVDLKLITKLVDRLITS